MKQLKHILFFLLLMLSIGYLHSQETATDSLNLRFCFPPNSACFMRSLHENESMLDKVREFMQLHNEPIQNESIIFHVYGYCGDGGTIPLRQQRVKRMSNYVKGEFINSQLVKEEHFITQNAIRPYNTKFPNVVILKCLVPSSKQQQQQEQQQAPAVTQEEEVPEQVKTQQPEVQQPETPQIPVSHTTCYEPALPASTTEKSSKPLFALKTNLLFDAASALNVEVEVPIKNRWSVLGEWIFPWWTFDNDKSDSRRHRFQLLNFNLEGRYWLGNRDTHAPLTGYFGGLYAGAGLFDFEWDRKGYQGEFFIAAGVSGGYAHSIAKNLRLEYSLGIGYMKIRYNSYEAIYKNDQRWHAMRKESGRQSWFGPTRAKVSLVWMIHYPFKIHNPFKKGGAR